MFMSMKAIFKSNEVRKFAGWLGALYIRIVHASGNWQVIGGEAALEFWKKGKPFILVFWHGRLLMMPYSWRHGQQIHLLISQHRDGQMLAHFVRPYGLETITGSTSKGGAAALRKLVKVLREGDCVGITPIATVAGPQVSSRHSACRTCWRNGHHGLWPLVKSWAL